MAGIPRPGQGLQRLGVPHSGIFESTPSITVLHAPLVEFRFKPTHTFALDFF